MERRRLLDIPHSEDLVFYAPLDLEHGTTEILHNITPITESGATVSWNTTKQMYNLYAYNNASGTTTSALYYQNIGMGLTDGQGVTICIDIEEQSMSATYPSMISTPKYIDGSNVMIRHATFNTSRYTLLKGRFVVTCSQWDGIQRIQKWYQNGILKDTVIYTVSQHLSLDRVTICETAVNNYNYRIYATNARIYNREMTAEEVANL